MIIRKNKELQSSSYVMKIKSSSIVRRVHRKVLDSLGNPVSRKLFRKTIGTPANIKLPSVSEKLIPPPVNDIFPQPVVMKHSYVKYCYKPFDSDDSLHENSSLDDDVVFLPPVNLVDTPILPFNYNCEYDDDSDDVPDLPISIPLSKKKHPIITKNVHSSSSSSSSSSNPHL